MKWPKFLKRFIPGKNKNRVYNMEDLDISERIDYVKQMKLVPSLEENISTINNLFGNSFDLNVRNLKVGSEKIPAALIHMSGLTDTRSLEEIMENVEVDLLKLHSISGDKEETFKLIKERLLNNKGINTTRDLSELLSKLPLGISAFFIDGVPEAILCETKGFQIRSLQEPDTEMVLRGPRDGFVENIFTNTSLLRQRIRVPDLWIQNMEIGSLSKTSVAISYIKGLASEELIDEVKSRLEKIDIDAVLESGYIQEYLYDEPYSIFPLIKRTERPDKVVSCLVEGKIIILTDGTPFALILPATFNMFLQAPDDYYELYPIGTFVRTLRYIGFLMSLLLPGLYVAIINFHQELLPISLLLRIAATREGVPFPVIVEALLMEGLFEVLREAGIRLPKAIGPAISIVGALVLGEAAINAGLASPPMVIIVALTAIASFTTPDYTIGITARIIRFIFLFLGAALGLFGIQFGLLILIIHLCSLRSFGQPYLQPFAPLIWSDLKDAIFRLQWWKFINRPKLMGGREPQRQNKGQKPAPPGRGKEGNEGDE